MNKGLYAITGIFDNPEAIIRAAKAAVKSEYKYFDVNTPYPVHGMDDAMNLRPSKLGYIALIIGLLGAASALFAMWYINVIDYPQVIGGKRFFPLPALIPITFEVTVLSASVMSVLIMLFIFFKLPNNSHPLHDTDYMKNVSSDKYGILILAEDPNFDEYKVRNFLEDVGAQAITPIYYDEEETGVIHRVFEPKFIIFLVIVGILNSALVYLIYNKVLYMPPFNFMEKQAKVIAQDGDVYFADNFSMHPPVDGTVARGNLPYFYKDDPEAAGRDLVNPLLPSKANLAKGEHKFNTFCSPCHGYLGNGESRLRGQFPVPPSLHSEKVRSWSDGRIYHVIMMGQNTMPSYAKQTTEEERWSIIHYIRALQRSQNARETD